MSTEPLSRGVRAVLDSPRGRRFSHPAHSHPQSREQRLLAQMEGNLRVAHRQAHGQLPAWMHLQEARLTQRERQEHEASEGPWKPSPVPGRPPLPAIPRPRPAPDDGPPVPRPPRPTLPRRPRRPHSHRKPRRRRSRVGRHLYGYALATLVGALVHHFTSGLF